jgi:hypothetical protein
MTDNLVMYAILALDSYNQGYDAQLNVAGNQLGDATILNIAEPTDSQSVAFYASAYNWNGQTVISYRGTNVTTASSFWGDVWNGYGVGAGSPLGAQASDAIQYFHLISGPISRARRHRRRQLAISPDHRHRSLSWRRARR